MKKFFTLVAAATIAVSASAESYNVAYFDETTALFQFYNLISEEEAEPLTVEINDYSRVLYFGTDGTPLYEGTVLKTNAQLLGVFGWQPYQVDAPTPANAAPRRAKADVAQATFALVDISVDTTYIDYMEITGRYFEGLSDQIQAYFPVEFSLNSVGDPVLGEKEVNGTVRRTVTITLDADGVEGCTAYFEGGLGGLYTEDYMNEVALHAGQNTITFVDYANVLQYGDNDLTYSLVIMDADYAELSSTTGTVTVNVPLPLFNIGNDSLTQGDDYVTAFGDTHKTVVLTFDVDCDPADAEFVAYFTDGMGGMYMENWGTEATLAKGTNSITFIDYQDALVPGTNTLSYNLVICEATSYAEVFVVNNGVMDVVISETVGIERVGAEAAAASPAYDLLGRRVKGGEGVVIRKGEKVLVK